VLPTSLAVLLALFALAVIALFGLAIGLALGFFICFLTGTKYTPRLMIGDLISAAAGMALVFVFIEIEAAVFKNFNIPPTAVLLGAGAGPIAWRFLPGLSGSKGKAVP
jgi:hypothetical protein